ncbi:ClpXP protease specificity-enhancing factor [Ignatzschineria cameli]|uniref:ClpXP protease specificity-enhancing factor n=1 Tax=Ignatzschineria cameli TaxID=2182793 RepID=UPI001EFD4AAB|nr:ClpXP protease specificity-enhancing factor [Ignatzschineria cameli]
MMTSNKPYFIRALYDWILDNNCTPYIVVDATLPYVDVPEKFIMEGRIILNVLPSAVNNLILGDEWISFSARFSGIVHEINFPVGAVAAIYAQENGEGMGFQTEALPDDYFVDMMQITPISNTKKSKPHFDIIESDDNQTSAHNKETSPIEGQSEKDSPSKINKDKAKSKKPSLTIIK